MNRKIRALLTAAIMCMSVIFGTVPVASSKVTMTAKAISVDFPMQLMNVAVKDNSKVLTEDGTGDGASLSVKALGGDLSASWRFDRVNTDANGTFFKLCNAQSGRLLTPNAYNVAEGTSVIMYGSESHKTQHWYVIPVEKDRLGNGLYYKIVNYSDTSLALTQTSSGMVLSSFTGADSQLWLLNSDGLQGFAGYCRNDNTGSIKAGDIGGLFGEVVEASSFDELKKYAESETPYTIVVNKNITVTNLKSDSQNHLYCPDGRIYVRSNKTIIGSYGAHTLYNVQFCTATKNGVGNNVIIKNFEMQHDAKSNGNDSIVVYFGSGENLWVDHVSFIGHSGYNTLGEGTPDWDKFLACCYDADYCTISDCWFGLHEYGLILGYPDDSDSSFQNKNNYPRMTLAGCKFKDTLTRAPGLMRYGYFHSLNNYVYNFSMAYTVCSASKVFTEGCYYDGASTKGNVVCDWDKINHPGSFADSGSKGVNCKRLGIEGTAQNCTWRPNGNYTYKAMSAEQAKSYCDAYSGCKNSSGDMMYMRMSTKGVPSAGFNTAPDGPMAPTPAVFAEGSTFRFKNVATGAYMSIDGYTGAGTSVFVMKDNISNPGNTWTLSKAGDGYYYIVSNENGGGQYVLDVTGNRQDNGTDVETYTFKSGKNQKFMLADNGDGTYTVYTAATGEKSVVEVDTATNNVQQWEYNGGDNQRWELVPARPYGAQMRTDVEYKFFNMNSAMVMDITDGNMASGTNIQQWGSSDIETQRWKLREIGGGYYLIESCRLPGFYLRLDGFGNGANLELTYSQNADTLEEWTYSITMVFGFIKTLDGDYYIMPYQDEGELGYIEVASASMESGANVQMWEMTESDCQKWSVNSYTTTTTTTTTETTTTTTETTAAEIVYGDANCDGKVSIADAVFIMQSLALPGKYQLSAEGEANADVSGGGNGVTNADALAIQKFMLGIITKLPE